MGPVLCTPVPSTEIALALNESATERELQRNRLRNGRQRAVRKLTLAPTSRMSLVEQSAILAAREPDYWRPTTRADCALVARPCPYVGCKHNLYLDISGRAGNIIVNFPDLEPDELGETCALDVADRGGETLEGVGQLMNVTRERVRQIANSALERLEQPIGELLREVHPR